MSTFGACGRVYFWYGRVYFLQRARLLRLGTFEGFHFVQKWPDIGSQNIPEAVDEAIALTKYARADSEVEKGGCEAWGIDFEDCQLGWAALLALQVDR